ncbi:MAG TPA: L-lactate permease, partial [Gammaproteobacteria bacterium]
MEQVYMPVADSLVWSTLAAALPILILLVMIGVFRKPAWISALTGLAVGFVVAIGIYGMPAQTAVSSTALGAAFGWFPIGWIVFWAVVL